MEQFHPLYFLSPIIKMRNPSIVPEFINSRELKIMDVNKVPVAICRPSQFILNSNLFQWPYILIDNIEKRKYISIEIKRIDVPDLIKMGFRLVSLKASPKTRTRARQAKVYIIESIDNPVPGSDVLYKVPKEHYLEMDIINKRIRIKGWNSFPYRRNENASEWIQIVEMPRDT